MCGFLHFVLQVPPIDSYSPDGEIPDKFLSVLEFRNVSFSYASRPDVPVSPSYPLTCARSLLFMPPTFDLSRSPCFIAIIYI